MDKKTFTRPTATREDGTLAQALAARDTSPSVMDRSPEEWKERDQAAGIRELIEILSGAVPGKAAMTGAGKGLAGLAGVGNLRAMSKEGIGINPGAIAGMLQSLGMPNASKGLYSAATRSPAQALLPGIPQPDIKDPQVLGDLISGWMKQSPGLR